MDDCVEGGPWNVWHKFKMLFENIAFKSVSDGITSEQELTSKNVSFIKKIVLK